MGVIGDVLRLMRAGAQQRSRGDLAENLRRSADLAERFAGQDPSAPVGSHGSASANPFVNLAAHQNGIPVAGTVISLAPTGDDIDGTPVYVVQLEVTADGRAPYAADYRTVIAAGALPNWQPGKVLPFRASPTDPSALLLG